MTEMNPYLLPVHRWAMYAIGWYSAVIANPELAFSADFWRHCQREAKSLLGMINEWGFESESSEAKAAIREGYHAALLDVGKRQTDERD